MAALQPVNPRKKHKVLSTEDRKAAYHMVLAMSKDGVPERESFSIVASLFGTNSNSISR
jgi:hypothetical protein